MDGLRLFALLWAVPAALVFLSGLILIFYKVSLMHNSGWYWWVFVVYLSLPFAYFAVFFPPSNLKGIKRIGHQILMPIGAGVFMYIGVFGGVPTLLHPLLAEPGSMVVTVADVAIRSARHEGCTRVLVISEFRWFPTSATVCPSHDVYQRARAGDRLRLDGSVSSFGIRPSSIRLMEIR